MPGLDPQVLLDVLRTYALYNPEIEYCQGMNYVASFLIMVFNNTEIAFKALVVIVKRFGIADLFNKQMPKIKVFFFQMDRLLNIVDADLNNHFREEDLSSTLFASAWFITIFTNSLKQNAENMVVNESLLQLWDYFMVAGWNAVLKMGVYILSSHSKMLQ